MSVRIRSAALAALLLAGLSACHAVDAPTAPPIHSRVALFRLDTKALGGSDLRAADPVTKAVLDQCYDGRLAVELRDAIDRECGLGSTTLLPRAFNDNLDYAWDQDPAPQLAIVARAKRRAGGPEDRVGGAVLGTIGWLLIGIPGYVIDDYDHYSPIELELTLYEGVARSDRKVADFDASAQPVATNFVDRNGVAFLPYVMTILIPPHVVSKLDQDDPEAVADLVTQQVLEAAARGIASRVRTWEQRRPEPPPPGARRTR